MRCDERLRTWRRCSSRDNFAVAYCLSIKGFVAGVIGFQGCTIQIEAREGSLGVAVKKNLCVGIAMCRRAISPGSRSVRPDRETIREQLGTQAFVHRQNYDVHFFATELYAQAAAIQGDRARCRPIAGIPARNESPSMPYSNNNGSFFESGNDHNAIGTGEFSRRNVVPGLRHLIENSGGFSQPCGCVIRARRSEN